MTRPLSADVGSADDVPAASFSPDLVRRAVAMDRLVGAPDALAYVRSKLVDKPDAAFDAAFSTRPE